MTSKLKDPQLIQQVEALLRTSKSKDEFEAACKGLGEDILVTENWENEARPVVWEENPGERIALINIPGREQPATICVNV